MTLPPFDKSIYWKEYQIETPCFRLTSLEKADMSPYLTHITGRNEILNILKGPKKNKGLLKAALPEVSKSKWYDQAIVCFTETPLFALDAFRYLSYHRWQKDWRFGIGFSKEKLVNKNVRPVLYVDSAIIAKMKELENSLPSDPEERDRNNGPRLANELILLIKPLIFPLLENEEKQGFMWEREWRYGNLGDFEFDYNDIEIICCPKEEREAIANILGDAIENINFIETWTQYDAIKKFLKSREPCWEEKIRKCEKEELDKLKIELKVELHKLTAYKEYILTLQKEENGIQEQINRLSSEIVGIERIISELIEKN